MALISFLQRSVTANKVEPAQVAGWLGLALGISTLARIGLNPLLGPTLVYSTYYPATLIFTLYLGWQAGLLLLLLSVLAANYFFVVPQYGFSPDTQSIFGALTFALAAGLIVLTANILRVTLVRLEAAHKLERHLNAELQHRIKNPLAVVQAVVNQSAKRYRDVAEFREALSARIGALAAAQDVLSHGRWELCQLPELARRVLAPFDDVRISLAGPECNLTPECCVPLVLALHELATNSLKYGALSEQRGTVDLTWKAEDQSVFLCWIEYNGPIVSSPKRQGLGSQLISTQPGLEEVTLEFKPEGVECRITVAGSKADGSAKSS